MTETTLPIFELRGVVMFDGSPNSCCILGYHSFKATAAGKQTYATAEYESSGRFAGVNDVSTLSHEVAEWQDDPFGNNPTKPWGNIGQVVGCQSNLEVGDPLSGTNVPTRHERPHLPSPGAGLLLVVLPLEAKPGRERAVLQQRHLHDRRTGLHIANRIS